MTTNLTKTEPAGDARAEAIAAMKDLLDRKLLLSSPPLVYVEEAFDAAAEVFARHEQTDVDRMMDQTGFASLEATPTGDVQMRLKMAAEIAQATVSAFDALITARGATNYVEWEATVTDPAREKAIEDNLPHEQWPPHRVYRYIVVAPGRPSPHELRQQADAKIAAVLALCDEGRPLDPREVATVLGRPPACTCPGGETGWHDDFDPDCPRHATPEPTPELLAELMPAAVQGARMEMGAYPELYDRNDPMSPILVNVLVGVLRALATPREGIWDR